MNWKCFLFLSLLGTLCFPQDAEVKKHTLDLSQFYGSVLLHNADISHLITNHPGGIILGYNRKTYGSQEWEELRNAKIYIPF